MTDNRPDAKIAARVAREVATRSETPIPHDVEVAWDAWIAGVRHVDERTKALLRAAFEVGVETGRSSSATK